MLHFFNQIGIGEKAGSGIPTIINAFLEEEYLEPILKEETNPDRTTLILSFDKKSSKNKVSLNELTEQETIIVNYLKENKQITRREVGKVLDLKMSCVNTLLKQRVDIMPLST